jgi:hypothetical protein
MLVNVLPNEFDTFPAAHAARIRLRSSVLIIQEERVYLEDCGADGRSTNMHKAYPSWSSPYPSAGDGKLNVIAIGDTSSLMLVAANVKFGATTDSERSSSKSSGIAAPTI